MYLLDGQTDFRSYRLAFMAACIAVAGSAVAAWFAARPMPSAAPDAQP